MSSATAPKVTAPAVDPTPAAKPETTATPAPIASESDAMSTFGERLDGIRAEYCSVDDALAKANGAYLKVVGRIGGWLAEVRPSYGKGKENDRRFFVDARETCREHLGRPMAESTIRQAMAAAEALNRRPGIVDEGIVSIGAAARMSSLSNAEQDEVLAILAEEGLPPTEENVVKTATVVRDSELTQEKRDERERKAATALQKRIRDDVVKQVTRAKDSRGQQLLASVMAAGCRLAGKENLATAVQVVGREISQATAKAEKSEGSGS
jgi:hypothetical protein